MAIEDANFISELVPGDPKNPDSPTEGAGHIRVTKKAVQQSFPNIGGVVNSDEADLNQLAGIVIQEFAPPGMVSMWATDTPPNGWLVCDGSAIAPEFVDLIAVVGANVPDLRDVFIRGAGAARLPLTTQVENVGPHGHDYVTQATGTSNDDRYLVSSNDSTRVNRDGPSAPTTNNPTGENIPANTALMYIIKT